MFSGVFQHSIDAKGRTSLPARFRELLSAQGADKLFITPDLIDPCLVAFAPSAWQRLAERRRQVDLRSGTSASSRAPSSRPRRSAPSTSWAGSSSRPVSANTSGWSRNHLGGDGGADRDLDAREMGGGPEAARAQETPQDLARRLSELL